MSEPFPGPKTKAALRRGIPLFKNGQRFEQDEKKAGSRGFRPVRQIVIDKAFVDQHLSELAQDEDLSRFIL